MSDRVCIEKYISQNDETAFSTLIERHRPFIRKVIFAVFGGWPEEAEEAEQEVFIDLSENLHRFRGDSSFSTYLYRLAKNRAIDGLRKIRRGRSRFVTLPEISGGEDPLDISIRNEDRRFLYAVLGQLKDEERMLILLKDIEGFSLEQITEMTGFPPGTVKSRLHRGRNRMIKAGEELMKKRNRPTGSDGFNIFRKRSKP